MKKARKRGVVYLDSIDLEILEFLDKPNFSEKKCGWGVLDIVDDLGVSHNNLKPHIDKLLRLKLITIVDISNFFAVDKKIKEKKKVGLTTIKAYNNYWFENTHVGEYEDDKEYKKLKEENEFFENVMDLLQATRSHFYNKEKEEALGVDLRRGDDIKRMSKNTKK